MVASFTAWCVVRDAQRRSLSLSNTGMATALDVGDMTNVHPADKPTVANRLALAARAIAYGEAVEFSEPLFRQVSGENGALRVWFDHADGLHPKGSEPLGFEIAGADHKFFPAIANIDEKTVVVHSDSVPHPESVRYGWSGWTSANLYNKEDLPAPPSVLNRTRNVSLADVARTYSALGASHCFAERESHK